jgi:glycosyltransferase involved in cell wall biosynthesis
MTPYLSLITPVYNGAHYIAGNLRTMLGVLEQLGEPFEILVICDGSTDGTADEARSLGDDRVKVLCYPVNAGKGFAIAHGIGEARGRLVGWLDSDLDVHADFIVEAVRRLREHEHDAVVGSKRHPESRVDYPRIRRVYSWGFQMLVRVLFRVNARDTQVGAKLFRREVLDTVAPLLLVKRYAYDLEVLAVGAEFGFDRIGEAPIQLDYRFSGTGIDTYAVRRMLLDTLAIAYRIHIRHHYVRRFAALQRERVFEAADVAKAEQLRLGVVGQPLTSPTALVEPDIKEAAG